MSHKIGSGTSHSYFCDQQLKIDSGSYGVVYYGIKTKINGESPELVAVKIFSKNKKEEEDIKATENEINALQLSEHNNVVVVYDIITTPANSLNPFPSIYLILELCNRGNLEEYVRKNDLSDLEIRYIFKKMVYGLHHIHTNAGENGFLHRDIKPSNVLLKDDEIKIADFGEARELKEGEQAMTQKGTPKYMNPQTIEAKPYSKKGDVFSLGVTLYFMYFKKTPWERENDEKTINIIVLKEMHKQILDDQVFDMIFDQANDVYISDSAKNLIKNMMQLEEEDRYDIDQVMKHPYLKVDKDGIKTPKITREINMNPFCRSNLSSEEKKYKKLFEDEIDKQKIREIMERVYYERDRIYFIHNCMKSVYDNSKEFQNKGLWYGLLVVLTRMSAFKSEIFYKYLKEKKKHQFFLPDDWNLFYNSGVYDQTLEVMKKCNEMTKNNLASLLNSLKNKKVDENLKMIIKSDYKPDVSFFQRFQDILMENLLSLQGNMTKGSISNKLINLMYELMILITMNQSLKYCKHRGFINFEKYNQDKCIPRNIEIMKNRLKIFFKLYFKQVQEL